MSYRLRGEFGWGKSILGNVTSEIGQPPKVRPSGTSFTLTVAVPSIGISDSVAPAVLGTLGVILFIAFVFTFVYWKMCKPRNSVAAEVFEDDKAEADDKQVVHVEGDTDFVPERTATPDPAFRLHDDREYTTFNTVFIADTPKQSSMIEELTFDDKTRL